MLGSNILLFDNVHDNASQDGPLFPASRPAAIFLTVADRFFDESFLWVARKRGARAARARASDRVNHDACSNRRTHRHALPSTDRQIGHHIVKGPSVPLFSAALASAPFAFGQAHDVSPIEQALGAGLPCVEGLKHCSEHRKSVLHTFGSCPENLARRGY